MNPKHSSLLFSALFSGIGGFDHLFAPPMTGPLYYPRDLDKTKPVGKEIVKDDAFYIKRAQERRVAKETKRLANLEKTKRGLTV